jgi:methionine-rich copper-binding protein CopC
MSRLRDAPPGPLTPSSFYRYAYTPTPKRGVLAGRYWPRGPRRGKRRSCVLVTTNVAATSHWSESAQRPSCPTRSVGAPLERPFPPSVWGKGRRGLGGPSRQNISPRVRRFTLGSRAAAALALAAALLLCAGLAGVRSALAHAHYKNSVPAIGAVVPAPPARVDIYTDQELAKIAGADTIAVTDAAGQRVDTGPTTVDDADRTHFWVLLQPGLASGRFVVSFTTLSDVDNDADHGRFAFYAGRQPTAEEQRSDAQLNSSAPAVAPAGSGSHSSLIFAVVAAAAVIVAAGVGVALLLRRR